MTPEQKAKEIIEKFKNHVNPYIGGGMLSNTHDDDAILWQSKQCANICIDEIILSNPQSSGWSTMGYWQQVKQEINNF